jgi:hypothetical protein
MKIVKNGGAADKDSSACFLETLVIQVGQWG